MRNKKSIFLLFFFAISNFTSYTVLIPIVTPLLIKPEYHFFKTDLSIHVRSILLGLVLATYPAAIFLGSPISGKIADSLGRKKVLFISTLSSVLGNLITAFSIIESNIFLLFAGRFICGITGGTTSTIKAIISDMSTPEERNKNYSTVPFATGLSNILGPLLGSELSNSKLISWFNFSTPLFFLSIVGFINLFLIFFFIEETLKEKRNFVFSPLKYFSQIYRAFSDPKFRLIFAVIFLFTAGWKLFNQIFQVYLVKKFDIDSHELGIIFSYIGIWTIFTQFFIFRPIAKHLETEKTIAFSLPILGIATLSLLIPKHYNSIFFVLPFVVIARGFIQTLLIGSVSFRVDNLRQGKIHSYHRSVQALGELSGPLIGGFLAAIAVSLPIIVSGLIAFGAWFVILWENAKRRREDTTFYPK